MPPKRQLIAVIDDDDSVRKALQRQIRAGGYRCHAFASAEEFLALAGLLDVAGVVCDVNLGGMSGLQLALHPKVLASDVPMVLISGSVDPRVEESARLVAAVFLRKPIPPGKLLEAIVDTVGPPITDEAPAES